MLHVQTARTVSRLLGVAAELEEDTVRSSEPARNYELKQVDLAAAPPPNKVTLQMKPPLLVTLWGGGAVVGRKAGL